MSLTCYKATVVETIIIGSRDISKKDIIRVKTCPAPTLTQDVEEDKIIKPILILTLNVINPLTEEGEKEYTEYRFLDEDGTVYLSSSDSLYNSLITIIEELVDEERTDFIEEFEFKIIKIKSNNQQGYFYTAMIV